MFFDKNGRELVLRNYEAKDIVSVQIGTLDHELWVCIDGVAVLRVNAPSIELDDFRTTTEDDDE